MRPYFIFAFVASLVVSFGLNFNVLAEKQYCAIIPTATPKPKIPAQIERIVLDRNEVVIPCPPSLRLRSTGFSECYDDDGLVDVTTIVSNPDNKPLNYQYKTSAGRVVGQGANIVWNLNGVRPGTYTIAAAIDEGRGFGAETAAMQVTVTECCCPIICECPTLSVTGKPNIKASESVVFTADASGGTGDDISYNWTVSQGEIVEGQGTSQIKVRTSPEMSGEIKATVEIAGSGLCAECPKTASAAARIIK